MDKYEYKMRAEEIKTLISRKRYTEAAQVADTIDWSRVKSVMMLCTVSDLYKVNRRFDDAKLLLEMANTRHPSGRMIIYSLCDISIKMGDVLQALEYFKEFVHIAPEDSSRYILQYKLYEAQDVGLEERIAVLEEMKRKEYQEKWAYELAYLYHRVGLATKCVEECDELILWFGEGKYVIKAMELKMLHQPLSPAQQQRYEVYMLRKQGLNVPEAMLQEPDIRLEQRAEAREEAPMVRRAAGDADIQVKTMDVGKYNTSNLQKELAESMKEVLQNGQVPQEAEMSGEPLLSEYREQIYREDAVPAEMAAGQPMEGQVYGYEQPAEEPVYVYDQPAEEPVYRYEQSVEAPVYRYEQPVEPPVYRYEQPVEPQTYRYEQQAEPQELPQVEKQITGQMSIEDIMREWDKVKQQKEEQRRQELKQRVMEHTGNLFGDFAGASRKEVTDALQVPQERESNAAESAAVSEEPVISAQTKIWAAGEVEKAIRRMSETSANANSFAGNPAAEQQMQEAARQEAERQEQLRQEAARQEAEYQEQLRQEAARQEAERQERLRQEAIRQEAERQKQLQQESAEQEKLLQESMFEDTATLNAAIAAIAADIEQFKKTSEPSVQHSEQQPVVQGGTVDMSKAQNAVREAGEIRKREILAREIGSGITAGTEQKQEQKKEPEIPVRETPVRSFSQEENKLFSAYVPTKTSMKKLIAALDTLSLAAYTGNMIVTGDPGSDVMDLVKNIVKDVKAKDRNFFGKMAKVTGQDLNSSKKDVSILLEQLAGGALIVEDAGSISQETMQKMLRSLNQDRWGILIILTDTKRNVRKLETENPDMEVFFNSRFDIEALDNGTLVSYGCQYARSKEYSIDEFGKLALHTRIEDMQTSDHNVTVQDVRGIVNEAIRRANSKTPKHFMDVLFAKRYDAEDMIILREKDFV